jgi:hypothetical protein
LSQVGDKKNQIFFEIMEMVLWRFEPGTLGSVDLSSNHLAI